MDAQQLAQKFALKIAAAASEKDRQTAVAADNSQKRTDDVEHCKRAMETQVIPFFKDLQHHFGNQQFSFSMQVDIDQKPGTPQADLVATHATTCSADDVKDNSRRTLPGPASCATVTAASYTFGDETNNGRAVNHGCGSARA